MNILLIDDNEVDILAIKRTLRHMDYEVNIDEASTAKEAINLFDVNNYDVVLMDYLLPDMDGNELLQQLTRHDNQKAAVIVVTGVYDDLKFEQSCIEAGAQDVVIKSDISQRHLMRAILHSRIRHRLEYELYESQRQLRVLAERDNLTGLSNRHYFDRSLRAAISRADRQNKPLALMFIDIDDFKIINDSYGHDIGDVFLRTIASVLQSMMRLGDDICRIGGDEFAVLVHQYETKDDLIQLADRLLTQLRLIQKVGSHDVRVSASLGIAIYPESAKNAADMLKAADLAMYEAKKKGKNKWMFFVDDLRIHNQNRIRMENELRALIPTAHFIFYYQPIIDARDFSVVGAEALLRWQHDERGILEPRDFIELANETGLIITIDNNTRYLGVAQLAHWLKEAKLRSDFKLHINICAQLLNDNFLEEKIAGDLNKAGVLAKNVSIEITESVLIDNIYSAANVLNKIRRMGVDIAVDDFGTGYASMAYLKHLPAKTLKIDRTFVQGVPNNETDSRILKAMINLGKSLQLQVTVEGIETLEQACFCIAAGADFLQGYYFSKPLSPEAFTQYLKAYVPNMELCSGALGSE